LKVSILSGGGAAWAEGGHGANQTRKWKSVGFDLIAPAVSAVQHAQNGE
jgi:hypothetical protein